ncbi:MAG: hypothetical protein ACOYL6_16940 [Bacteriovoracaceae bacterium]
MKIAAIFLFSSLLFSVSASSDMALAKMAPERSHMIADVITQFTKMEPKNDDIKQVLELAIIARDVFDVKEVFSNSSNPVHVNQQDLIRSMRSMMASLPKWDNKLPSPRFKKLELNKSILNKSFGQDSYEWAWVLNQLGDKSAAKKILLTSFENEYKNVMSQKQAVFGFGDSPLSKIEPAYKALEAIADEKEKIRLKEKMGKAKQHISRLPQSHIMT